MKARIELDETNFNQEVMDVTHPVMVQAWASWSAPCREMTPMLESVADDGSVPVKLARLNVEQNEELAIQYGVWAVPTVLIFNLGSLQDQIVGRATEAQVRAKLEPYRVNWRALHEAAELRHPPARTFPSAARGLGVRICPALDGAGQTSRPGRHYLGSMAATIEYANSGSVMGCFTLKSAPIMGWARCRCMTPKRCHKPSPSSKHWNHESNLMSTPGQFW